MLFHKLVSPDQKSALGESLNTYTEWKVKENDAVYWHNILAASFFINIESPLKLNLSTLCSLFCKEVIEEALLWPVKCNKVVPPLSAFWLLFSGVTGLNVAAKSCLPHRVAQANTLENMIHTLKWWRAFCAVETCGFMKTSRTVTLAS